MILLFTPLIGTNGSTQAANRSYIIRLSSRTRDPAVVPQVPNLVAETGLIRQV